MKTPNKEQNHKTSIIRYWVPAILVVLVLWGGSWIFLINSEHLSDWQQRAEFGEMFGVVNALFAGLAFAGVIIAIHLQRKELELQRVELEETRNELRGQKEQLELQNVNLKRQNYEDKFFQLITLQNEIVNSIVEHVSNREIHGRDWFRKSSEDLLYKMRDFVRGNPNSDPVEVIKSQYKEFYKYNQSHLNHYFESVGTILDYIERGENYDEVFYVNVLRSQLSGHELFILFCHGLIDQGRNLKPLIEKYGLFKNLSKTYIFPDAKLSEKVTSLYDETAFTE